MTMALSSEISSCCVWMVLITSSFNASVDLLLAIRPNGNENPNRPATDGVSPKL